MTITFAAAHPKYRASLKTLLRSFQLATEDLPLDLKGFTLALENDVVIGSAGLERVGPYGLLRSFAVHESFRNQGLGEQLYAAALEVARASQIREVWLITTTADRYFEKHGFERIERTEAPVEISAIPQFTSLCAASAVVMRKLL